MATEFNSGIYTITSPSGNFYVGSSKNIKTRWRQHKRELQKQIHSNAALQNVVNKYGIDSLVFEIVWFCDPKYLLKFEQNFLDYFTPEYNIAQVAGSGPNLKGISKSEEHKRKMSEALLGNTRWLGKKHKPETIEKMRQKALGRKPSDRKFNS